MQQKAPTQMHFIITIITDNPLRDVGFFFCWGWGGFPSFLSLPPHFTYIASVMPDIVSGRNYANKFTAFMGAYTMMNLMIPETRSVCVSDSLGQPKKPTTALLHLRLTRLLVASLFHGCSCQVYAEQ